MRLRDGHLVRISTGRERRTPLYQKCIRIYDFRYQDRLKIAQEYGLFDQKFHFHQGQYDIIGAWAIWGHMGP